MVMIPNTQTIDAALEFMSRVELRGREVDAWIQVAGWLQNVKSEPEMPPMDPPSDAANAADEPAKR